MRAIWKLKLFLRFAPVFLCAAEQILRRRYVKMQIEVFENSVLREIRKHPCASTNRVADKNRGVAVRVFLFE